ncbi:TPA: hypothetical protein ACT9LY_002621, partial [Legionella pneumophila]
MIKNTAGTLAKRNLTAQRSSGENSSRLSLTKIKLIPQTKTTNKANKRWAKGMTEVNFYKSLFILTHKHKIC